MADPNAPHAELLTPPGNYAVVQLPGRRFPGVVFQGDSLAVLCEEAANLAKQCADAVDLSASLDSILRGYIAVLDQLGIELPFSYRPQPE